MMTDGGDTPEDTGDVLKSMDTEEQTTCPVCLEVFSHPKLLPCFHTFCAECIRRVQSDSAVVCPLCRNACMLNEEDLNSLPPNYFMEAMIKARQCQANEQQCEACEDGMKSENFCYDCRQHLCSSCYKVHQALRSTRTHRVCKVSNSNEKIIQMNQKSFCVKHKDEILRFFCRHCDVSICRDCKVTNHEGHETKDLEDCKEEETDTITRAISELNSQATHLEKHGNLCDECIKTTGAWARKAEGQIESMRERFHLAVDTECDKLRKDVNDKLEQQKTFLLNVSTKMSSESHAIAWTKSHFSSVLKFGTTADAVGLGRSIRKRKFDVARRDLEPLQFSLPIVNCLDANDIQLKSKLVKCVSTKPVQMPSVRQCGTFALFSANSLGIVKLQVTEDFKCFVLFQHPHGFSVPLNTAYNLICCDETGLCMTRTREQGLKDIVWSERKLFKIFHSYSGARVSTDEDSKDAVENRISVQSVCAFKSSDGRLVSFDCQGQIIDNDTALSIEARPSSAVCLASGKMVVCYPTEHLVAVYSKSGKKCSAFSPKEHETLPSNFHPRSISCYDWRREFVYVADYENNAVYVLDIKMNYVLTVLDKSDGIYRPTALCLDGKGRIWVGHSNNKISIFHILHSEEVKY